jgi:hypothetical protein
LNQPCFIFRSFEFNRCVSLLVSAITHGISDEWEDSLLDKPQFPFDKGTCCCFVTTTTKGPCQLVTIQIATTPKTYLKATLKLLDHDDGNLSTRNS